MLTSVSVAQHWGRPARCPLARGKQLPFAMYVGHRIGIPGGHRFTCSTPKHRPGGQAEIGWGRPGNTEEIKARQAQPLPKRMPRQMWTPRLGPARSMEVPGSEPCPLPALTG